MTEQAWWVVAIVAVVISGALGYFIGRPNSESRSRVEELEGELARHKAEMDTYRSSVDAHFEQTAGLFVSMAGSYKALFEHLAVGYDKLAPGTSRDLFKEKVAALLLDAPGREVLASHQDKFDEGPTETDTAEADAAEADAAALARGDGKMTEPVATSDSTGGAAATGAPGGPTEQAAERAPDAAVGSTDNARDPGPHREESLTSAASAASAASGAEVDDNAAGEKMPRV